MLDAAFDSPPFNLILREAPKPWRLDPALHWYLEVIPRLTQLGGFELATGITVNALTPEAFAKAISTGPATGLRPVPSGTG
jgi:UDPglucose--hexose-1-phosphate uridylyltransferase